MSNGVCIVEGYVCGTCGWPIIDVCCNDGMSEPPYGADWWWYCSNKTCQNHAGSAYFQDEPEWVTPIKKEEG